MAKAIWRAPAGGVNWNVVSGSRGLVFQSEKFAQNCGWPGSPDVGQDDAQRQRARSVGDPILEVDDIRAAGHVMRSYTSDVDTLDVIDGLHTLGPLRRQASRQEPGERHAHAQVADEVDERVVDRSGLRRPGEEVGVGVEDRDVLAVEQGQVESTIAGDFLHA